MAGKMASRKKKEKAFNVLAFFIVLILAALVLLPIWWIFRSSLMSTAALNEYPPLFLMSGSGQTIPKRWRLLSTGLILKTHSPLSFRQLPLVPSLRFFADMPLQDFVSAGKS